MIIGIFEGKIDGDQVKVLIHHSHESGNIFGTMYLNGEFFHKDKWTGNEKTTIQACKDKCEIWQTQADRNGHGFMSVHGIFCDAGIVQDMSR